jgi:hypothetical protein
MNVSTMDHGLHNEGGGFLRWAAFTTPLQLHPKLWWKTAPDCFSINDL